MKNEAERNQIETESTDVKKQRIISMNTPENTPDNMGGRTAADANTDSDFSRDKPMTASQELGGHQDTLEVEED